MRPGRGEPFIGVRPERKKPVCKACGDSAPRPHSSHRNRLLDRPCLSCGSFCVPVFRQFTNFCATCGADRTIPPGKNDRLARSVARTVKSIIPEGGPR